MSPTARKDVPEGAELYAMRLGGVTYSQLAQRFDCSVGLIQARVERHLGNNRAYDSPATEYDPPPFPRRVGWLWEVPGWFDRALCAQTDPEGFFPEKGGSTREAKSVCAKCTVSAECLDWALEHDERHGIWGGLSERERRRISADLDNQQEPA